MTAASSGGGSTTRTRRRWPRAPDRERRSFLRDAVGAEEDAEVGVEAVVRVDEEVVGQLEHGGASPTLEVHEHGAVAGMHVQDLLESLHLVVGQGIPAHA